MELNTKGIDGFQREFLMMARDEKYRAKDQQWLCQLLLLLKLKSARPEDYSISEKNGVCAHLDEIKW